MFHRVRNGIEKLVERVFFRASHARHTALQHFLETAPNFSEPDALAGALLKAVDAYAGSRGRTHARNRPTRDYYRKLTVVASAAHCMDALHARSAPFARARAASHQAA
jgi:hypothetical protein